MGEKALDNKVLVLMARAESLQCMKNGEEGAQIERKGEGGRERINSLSLSISLSIHSFLTFPLLFELQSITFPTASKATFMNRVLRMTRFNSCPMSPSNIGPSSPLATASRLPMRGFGLTRGGNGNRQIDKWREREGERERERERERNDVIRCVRNLYMQMLCCISSNRILFKSLYISDRQACDGHTQEDVRSQPLISKHWMFVM